MVMEVAHSLYCLLYNSYFLKITHEMVDPYVLVTLGSQ